MGQQIAIKGGTSAVNLGAILADPSVINAEQMYHLARHLVNAHPEAEKLRESLAANLAYDTQKGRSGFSATLHDAFAGKDSPSTLYISPYAIPGAGATVALTYGDQETQDVYVLLARKRDPERPGYLTNKYFLVGGYLDPHEPGEPGSTARSDKNLEATALRELKEETGLTLPGAHPHLLSVNSDYGYSNDPRLHTVNAFYHVGKTGPIGEMPALTPGDDVVELTWVNAKQISFHPEIGAQPHSSPLSRYVVHMPGGDLPLLDSHGGPLEMAVSRARETMMEQFRHRLATLPKDALKPLSSLGPEAHAYHVNRLQCFAARQAWNERVSSPAFTAGPRTLQ